MLGISPDSGGLRLARPGLPFPGEDSDGGLGEFLALDAIHQLIGRFQRRYGPNRVGPYGLMQPIWGQALQLLAISGIRSYKGESKWQIKIFK